MNSLHDGSDLRVPSCHVELKHVQTGSTFVSVCFISFMEFHMCSFEPCHFPQVAFSDVQTFLTVALFWILDMSSLFLKVIILMTVFY